MSLRIKTNSGVATITTVELSRADNCFQLFDREKLLLGEVKIPFAVSDLPEKFIEKSEIIEEIYAFRNDLLNQISVIELRTNDRSRGSGTIGYFFRSSSLDEFEVEIFTNVYVKTAAVRTMYALLNDKTNISSRVSDEDSFGNYQIESFYNEDVVILNLPHIFIQEIEHFNVDNYLYDLYNYGFSYIKKSSVLFCNESNQCNLIYEKFNGLTDQNGDGYHELKVEKISIHLCDEHYFFTLIKDMNNYYVHPILRFQAVYQAIEIIKDKVLKAEIKKIVENHSSSNESGYQLKDKIDGISTDSKKIAKIFGAYSNIPAHEKEELKKSISYFLKKVISYEDKDISKMSLSTLVYKFRNNLTHNFKLIVTNNIFKTEHHLSLINKVNDDFEVIIMSLCLSFKIPHEIEFSAASDDDVNDGVDDLRQQDTSQSEIGSSPSPRL